MKHCKKFVIFFSFVAKKNLFKLNKNWKNYFEGLNMRINNINLPVIQSTLANNNFLSSPRVNTQASTGDTFIKNVNFTANHLQKVDTCAGFLKKYVMSESVNLSKIEEIFKKFLPDISVKSLNELPEKLSKRYIAYTSIKIGEPEVIYIDIERNISTPEQRIRLLGGCVHEFTHACQNQEKHFSVERFISKVFEDYPDSPSLRSTIEKLREFAANVEFYSLYPVLKGMKNETGLPVLQKGSENKLLQKFTSNIVGNYDKYVDNVLIKYFSNAAEDGLNLPVLLKFLQRYMKQELEAYTKETEVMKAVMNTSRQTTDFDIRNFAYSRVIQRCEEFKRKFA